MTRTAADEWYDDWLARTAKKARHGAFLKTLEHERRAVMVQASLHGSATYDAATETARQLLRRNDRGTHVPMPR